MKYAKKILHTDDPLQFVFNDFSRAFESAFILNGLIDICTDRRRPIYIYVSSIFIDFRLCNPSKVFFRINKSMFSKVICHVKMEQFRWWNIFNLMWSSAKGLYLHNIIQNIPGRHVWLLQPYNCINQSSITELLGVFLRTILCYFLNLNPAYKTCKWIWKICR